MCDGHSDTLVTVDGRPRSIDRCIAPLVEALNSADLATVASCCGHGRQPSRIDLRDGRAVFVVIDYETAQRVTAAFPPIYPAPPVPQEDTGG